MWTYGTGLVRRTTPRECEDAALCAPLDGEWTAPQRRRLGFWRWLVVTGRVQP